MRCHARLGDCLASVLEHQALHLIRNSAAMRTRFFKCSWSHTETMSGQIEEQKLGAIAGVQLEG
ncbi:MAG: hypothetical protein ACI87A_003150 [Planctomycetota bacterium]|jgi:hypothetical protein